MGSCPLTGKKRSNTPLTSILSHHEDTSHPIFFFEDFKTLSSSSFKYKLLLHERMPLSKLKLSLNAYIGSAPLTLL